MKNKVFYVLLFVLNFTFFSCKANEDTKIKNETRSVETVDLSLNNSSAENSNDLNAINDEISNTRKNALTNAIEKCSPAIVGINVTEVRQVAYREQLFDDPFFRHFFGNRYGRTRTREYEVQGLGSGYIISPDGYILTNHHVAGNASKIIVTMTDGNEYEAEIIGSDMVTDVALLKIDGENLPYVKLGNSDNVIVGEWAIAFGNPFGLFDMNAKPTVTVGVVSNTGISFINQDKPFDRVYKDMIQTDAAISSGNSGGPLINADGEVIGMNTVIFSTAQSRQGAGSIGIGFSIPINRVKKVVEQLKKHQKIDRNFYIGMGIRELDEKLSNYLDLDIKKGVVVFELNRKAPAENQGFELGDVILEINGNKILREEDYYINVLDAHTGDTLEFKVLRDGKEKYLKLKLESRD